ncbi:MAG: twin transmembrane helix small protein [Methylococcaceae bacterium]|jgi:DMSO reductase anchor subunit
MLIKTVVIFAFLLILLSLGSALFNIVKHKDQANSQKTLNALTLRITLSITLFIFIFIAVANGWIEPHGIGARSQSHDTTSELSNKN